MCVSHVCVCVMGERALGGGGGGWGVYMCICKSLYIYVCVFVHMYLYICRLCECIYACAFVMHMHTCYVNVSMGMLVYMSVYRGFPTRMVYLYYISCLRYTILVGNPRYMSMPLPSCMYIFVNLDNAYEYECICMSIYVCQ